MENKPTKQKGKEEKEKKKSDDEWIDWWASNILVEREWSLRPAISLVSG